MSTLLSSLLVFIFTVLVSGCRPRVQPEFSALVQGTEGTKRALLVTGLNTNEVLYAELAKKFRSLGFSLSLLRLEGGGERFNKTLVGHWRGQLHEVLEQHTFDVIAGYSQGALLVLDCVLSSDCANYKILLFAPPVATYWYTHLVRLLFPLADLNLRLPSFAQEKFRLQNTVSLKSYIALFKLQEEVFRVERCSSYSPVRMFTVMGLYDELVDYGTTTGFLKQCFPEQTFLVLSSKHSEAANHLLVHPDGGGEDGWEILLEQLDRFMSSGGGEDS